MPGSDAPPTDAPPPTDPAAAPPVGDTPPAEGEDSPLLVAPPGEPTATAEGGEEGGDTPPPAKRDDGSYLTPGSNGKWYKKKTHSDHYRGRRQVSMQSQGVPGYKDLKSLSHGIYENLDSTYIMEEQKIIQSSQEIKALIERMEARNNEV